MESRVRLDTVLVMGSDSLTFKDDDIKSRKHPQQILLTPNDITTHSIISASSGLVKHRKVLELTVPSSSLMYRVIDFFICRFRLIFLLPLREP